MNRQFGTVTLACTIFPDLTLAIQAYQVGVDGNQQDNIQNLLMMIEVQVGLLRTQGQQSWKPLLQRREAR